MVDLEKRIEAGPQEVAAVGREPQGYTQWGLNASDINDERFGAILGLYDRITGGYSQKTGWHSIGYLQDSITFRGIEEYTFGSRFTPESKLLVRRVKSEDGKKVVVFEFDPNCQAKSRVKELEVKRVEGRFRRAVNEYLRANGLGVPVAS